MTQDYVPPSPDENSESCAPPWTVYGISREGDEDDPFYIGITRNIRRRALMHNHDQESAAHDRVKAYNAQGIHCSMTPLATYQTVAEARAYEMALIAIHPGLVNRNVVSCVRAFTQERQRRHRGRAKERQRLRRARLKANAAKTLAETVAADG